MGEVVKFERPPKIKTGETTKVRQAVENTSLVPAIVKFVHFLGVENSNEQTFLNDLKGLVLGKLRFLNAKYKKEGFGGYEKALKIFQVEGLQSEIFDQHWKSFVENFFLSLIKNGEVNLLKTPVASADYLLGELVGAFLTELREDESVFANEQN